MHANPEYDQELFLSVRADGELCYQEFQGNGDLYGLGIRIGIYLQWVASLLSNNLLPENRKEHDTAYLIFSTSICAATFVSSFAGSCVFSIEIEILYWLYWGGFMCVVAFSPNQIRLGRHAEWVTIHWSSVFQFTTHTLMTYHGIWFIWHAYDYVFARMPCGTYQFFLAPVLDPSRTFCVVRDSFMQVIAPFVATLLLGIPLVAILLFSEIKKSILDSAPYQMVFPRPSTSGSGRSETTAPDTFTRRLLLRLRVFLRSIEWPTELYRRLRQTFGLPLDGRSGIRYITPLELGSRRYIALLYSN